MSDAILRNIVKHQIKNEYVTVFSKLVDEEYVKLIYSKYIIFNMDNCSLKVNVTEKLQCVNYKY